MNRAGRCETRPGLLRAHHTRIASETIWNIFELVTANGTVVKLVKSLDDLCTLTLAGAAPASIEASLVSTGPADIVEANHFAFIADQRTTNYVSTGVTGASNTLALTKAAPTSALSPTGNGAGSGLVAGVYRVCYAFRNPTFGWTTPPRAVESVTITAGQNIRVTTPTDPSDGFTTMDFFRTLVGEVGPLYYVASSTTYSSTADLSVGDTDVTNNPATYYQSPLHNDDGEIVAANPSACKFACWHKHRLALGSDSTNLLRIVFSDLDKPTQFFVSTIAKDPAHYHDLEAGQGRKFTGLNTFNGALVCFKNASITIRNGDIDPASWTWFVAVDGIGNVAPWSRAVAPGVGIFFAGQDGVYILTGDFGVRKISDRPDGAGIGDDYRALDFSKVEYWWGVWDERQREYLLAVTTSSATSNAPDRVYSYALDTGAWTTREYGMGSLLPTCAGTLTNASSVPKVYIGTSTGFCYETGYSTLTDGPISGTVTGTAAAGSSTTDIVSTGFYDTGDDLTGLVATVRHSATSYESRLIASNTSTTITLASALSSTALSKTFFVGAIQSTLTLAPWDADSATDKQWHETTGQWAKQTHTTPVRVGFTLDDQATPPTYTGDEETMGDVRFGVGINDFAVECAPHFDVVGTSAPMELRTVEMVWSPCETGSPAS